VADDSGNFTARWSLISGSLRDGVSLSSVVRTPLIKWASEAEELTSFSFPMVILAGSLAPKTTYVFTLSSVNNQVRLKQLVPSQVLITQEPDAHPLPLCCVLLSRTSLVFRC
jgi:hypothetical protein